MTFDESKVRRDQGKFAAKDASRDEADIDLDTPSFVSPHGDMVWKNSNGEIHRDGDLPAIVYSDGSKTYMQHDQIHRDGGKPACEGVDGSTEYWVYGQMHRDGGLPAVSKANGYREYRVGGLLHRDGDLPAVEHPGGGQEYWRHGNYHRDNGLPAVIINGNKEFWTNGKLIRRELWNGAVQHFNLPAAE